MVEGGDGASDRALAGEPEASFPESVGLKVLPGLTLPDDGPEAAPDGLAPRGRRFVSALTAALRASTFLSVKRTLCPINSCRLA